MRSEMANALQEHAADEDAFAVVNEMDGMTIKVGEGETVAKFRVPSVAALRRWLAGFEELEPMGTVS